MAAILTLFKEDRPIIATIVPKYGAMGLSDGASEKSSLSIWFTLNRSRWADKTIEGRK